MLPEFKNGLPNLEKRPVDAMEVLTTFLAGEYFRRLGDNGGPGFTFEPQVVKSFYSEAESLGEVGVVSEIMRITGYNSAEVRHTFLERRWHLDPQVNICNITSCYMIGDIPNDWIDGSFVGLAKRIKENPEANGVSVGKIRAMGHHPALNSFPAILVATQFRPKNLKPTLRLFPLYCIDGTHRILAAACVDDLCVPAYVGS